MPSSDPSLVVDVHLGPDELISGLRADALAGLSSQPKELSPTWFYDETGCQLFDAITELPEYYPTRAERSILERHGNEIAKLSAADTFIELGSGTCDKTRLLLDALVSIETLDRYVPFDVAEPTLRLSAQQLMVDYPGIQLHGVVGDFRRHLDRLPRGGRRMLAILGGTIGNLKPGPRAEMLDTLSSTMIPGDSLLVGTDLVKDRDRLVRAYDDSAGVTAAFNLNALTRLNRELGADFDVDRFAHVARFDEDHEWIEMRLRSIGRQVVYVADLDLVVEFDNGETMRTEVSSKFRPERWVGELEGAGLELAGLWTDPDGDFALSLAIKPEDAP